MAIAVIVLAAGQGTRMLSTKPKVLHKIAGRSLLTKVLSVVNLLDQTLCAVVHGHKGEMVINTVNQELQSLSNIDNLKNLCWVEQTKQLGTGHAVQIAIQTIQKQLDQNGIKQILVLYGDVPLVDIDDLNKLISSTKSQELGLLTLNSSNPFGLGRIIRDEQSNIIDIIEEKEANSKQKLISEVNTGIFLLPYPKAKQWLNSLDTNNNQHEYYLTDIVKKCVYDNVQINSVTVSDQNSYRGINTLYQLAEAERHNQFLLSLQLLEKGVKIIDPNRIDIRGDLQCDKDVYIDINCLFEGKVILGQNCTIEPNCILKNAVIGDNVHVKANSIIEDSVIGNECIVGPFARIRPHTVLDDGAHVGNFVEIKKSNIGKGTKVNHLSYIGDTTIGQKTNIGAGTITCNYDGVNKYNTIIGDNAFVGSNTALIAPITIGDGAVIGAGSTVYKDAPENKLTIARSKQTTVDSWQRKDKTS